MKAFKVTFYSGKFRVFEARDMFSLVDYLLDTDYWDMYESLYGYRFCFNDIVEIKEI